MHRVRLERECKSISASQSLTERMLLLLFFSYCHIVTEPVPFVFVIF